MEKKDKKPYSEYGVVDFSKLWLYLEKKGYNKQYLRDNGIHGNTISKLTKNENVNCEVLAKLCYILKCDIKNICEYKMPGNTEK